MRKTLYAYAWDFVDEGLDCVLDRIKSLGMDGIAIAASYHAGKFVLPHNPNHRVYFPEDGTVYFAPRDSYYPGRLKPSPASMIESGDTLAAVADGCKRFDLNLTAWTVCMHNTRLGSQHPDLTVKNAYGDRYPYCLCPAQPESAEYALGLIRDLTENYPLDTIFLEALGYMGFAHGFHHELYGVRLGACEQALMGLCFCDACAARAAHYGIDADRVAQIVRDELSPTFTADAAGDGCSFLELVDTYPELAAYLQMRQVVVMDILERVRRIADNNGVGVDYFGPSPCSRALPEAIDMARAAAIADRYVIPVGSPDVRDAESDIYCAKSIMPGDKIILSINMGVNSTPTREGFQDKIALIDRHSLAGCNLYNYSILTFERLAWLIGLETSG